MLIICHVVERKRCSDRTITAAAAYLAKSESLHFVDDVHMQWFDDFDFIEISSWFNFGEWNSI